MTAALCIAYKSASLAFYGYHVQGSSKREMRPKPTSNTEYKEIRVNMIDWDIYQERNERFKELVKGKSVALIARAPYLCTLKQADKINSYDLVARVVGNPHGSDGLTDPYPWSSDGKFVTEDLSEFTGRRTDIWYTLTIGTSGLLPDILARLKQGDSLKELRNIRPDDLDKIQDETMSQIESCFAMSSVLPEVDEECGIQVGSFPRTGTLAAYDLSLTEASEIYITGMTTNFDGGLAVVKAANIHGHNAINDLTYLHELVGLDPRITVDDKMIEVFEKYCTKL